MPNYISRGGRWDTVEKIQAEKEAQRKTEEAKVVPIIEEKPKKKTVKKKAKPKSTN